MEIELEIPAAIFKDQIRGVLQNFPGNIYQAIRKYNRQWDKIAGGFAVKLYYLLIYISVLSTHPRELT